MKKKINALFCICIICFTITSNASMQDAPKKLTLGIGAGGNFVLAPTIFDTFAHFFVSIFTDIFLTAFGPVTNSKVTIEEGKSANLFFSYILSNHFRLKSGIDLTTTSTDMTTIETFRRPKDSSIDDTSILDSKVTDFRPLGKLHFAQWNLLLSFYLGKPNNLKFFTGIGVTNIFVYHALNQGMKSYINNHKYTKYKTTPIFELGLEYPINKIFFMTASINHSWQKFALSGDIDNSKSKTSQLDSMFDYNYSHCSTTFYKLGLHWKF